MNISLSISQLTDQFLVDEVLLQDQLSFNIKQTSSEIIAKVSEQIKYIFSFDETKPKRRNKIKSQTKSNTKNLSRKARSKKHNLLLKTILEVVQNLSQNYTKLEVSKEIKLLDISFEVTQQADIWNWDLGLERWNKTLQIYCFFKNEEFKKIFLHFKNFYTNYQSKLKIEIIKPTDKPVTYLLVTGL